MSKVRAVGVDIGTGFIASGEVGVEPNTAAFRKIRDCFLKIDPSKFMGGAAPMFGEKMLKKTGAKYIKVGDILYILGDSAFKMANTIRQTTLRPMSKGVLNPKEPLSKLMVQELIKAVAGEAKNEEGTEDVLFYCVPANPVDAEYNVDYHRDTLEGIFKEIGYKNISCIDEGLAVVFSELENDDFTGIGISFGAGMVNVTYAFMGMPILSFAISKGGDYVDENAANSVDENPTTMTRIKEKGVDLMSTDGDNQQQAIISAYRSLLKYLVANITKLYNDTDKSNLPDLYDPIKIVVAGGTSLATNFTTLLKSTIDNDKDFPFEVKEVVSAEEPLFAVAHGLYRAAQLQTD